MNNILEVIKIIDSKTNLYSVIYDNYLQVNFMCSSLNCNIQVNINLYEFINSSKDEILDYIKFIIRKELIYKINILLDKEFGNE